MTRNMESEPTQVGKHGDAAEPTYLKPYADKQDNESAHIFNRSNDSKNTNALVSKGVLPEISIDFKNQNDTAKPAPIDTLRTGITSDGTGPQKGIGAVVAKLAEGAIDEITHHPWRVAGNVAAGAGIAALSTVLSPALLVGAGTVGIGLLARGIYNNAGDLLNAAQTVANPQGVSPEALALAEKRLRQTGGEGIDFASGIVGGSSSLALKSLAGGLRSGISLAFGRGNPTATFGELAFPAAAGTESSAAVSGGSVSISSGSGLIELSSPAARGLRIFNAAKDGAQASDKFISSSLDGLKALGNDHVKELARNDVRIVFGRTMEDINPGSNSPAAYASDLKTIFLPEQRPGLVANSSAEVAAHESGHAIDHIRGWISQSASFQEAHMADISADTRRRLFQYLVNGNQIGRAPWQSTPRGRQEAFATLFQQWNHANSNIGATPLNQWKETSKWLIDNGFVNPDNVSQLLRRQLNPTLTKALEIRAR